MSIPNCAEVCGIVHQAAIDLGLDVREYSESHEPVMKALDKMIAYLLANKYEFREALGFYELEEGGQE